jgi:hypothetical protein
MNTITKQTAPRELTRGTTVKELREMLEEFDDDALVVFSYNYGDYHRTQAVSNIDYVEERALVSAGGYSETGWAVSGDENAVYEDDAIVAVVIS